MGGEGEGFTFSLFIHRTKDEIQIRQPFKAEKTHSHTHALAAKS
jgi:hypothetical protein